MPGLMTIKEYKNRLKLKFKTKISLLSTTFSGTLITHKHKCHKHNKIFYKSPANLLYYGDGNGCSKCVKEALSSSGKSKALSNSEYKNRCSILKIKPIQKYINLKTTIKHKCLQCNFVFEARPANVLWYKKSGCPKCKNPYQYRSLKDWGELVDSNLKPISIENGWLTLYCKTCKNESVKSVKTLANYPRCKHCVAATNGEKNRMTFLEFKKRLKQSSPPWIKLITTKDEFSIASELLVFHCSLHNITYRKVGYNTIRVDRDNGCSKCTSAYKMKEYKLNDRLVLVQGYEPQALDWIKQNLPSLYKDIKTFNEGLVPTIQLPNNKSYRPDLFSDKHNHIIEVKSIYTLTQNTRVFNLNKLKFNTVKKLGYKFTLLVMDGKIFGRKVVLPRNWITMTAKQLRSCLFNRGYI